MYENTKEEIMKAKSNSKAFEELMSKNAGLVWSIVKRFARKGIRRRRTISSRGNGVGQSDSTL